MSEPIRIPIETSGQAALTKMLSSLTELKEKLGALGQGGSAVNRLRSEVDSLGNAFNSTKNLGSTTLQELSGFRSKLNSALDQLSSTVSRKKGLPVELIANFIELGGAMETGYTKLAAAVTAGEAKLLRAQKIAEAAAATAMAERVVKAKKDSLDQQGFVTPYNAVAAYRAKPNFPAPLSLDETRAMLGMPDRNQMKSLAAQLKNQMQDDLSQAALKAKSATSMGLDDTRRLLGMPDRSQMKTFAAQLKSQMQDDLSQAALKAKSATSMNLDETRALLGMPTRTTMQLLAKDIATQMNQAVALERRLSTVNMNQSMQFPGGVPSTFPAGSFSKLGGDSAGYVKMGEAAKNATPHLLNMNKVMAQGHSLARGLASGFNAMWLTWGSLVPLLAGAAISASFVKAAKAGSAVAENLADIRELAGATAPQIAEMSKVMSNLAETSAYGPIETSKALKILSLAGLDAKDSMLALKPTLDFAMAGGVATERAAETLVAVATAYGYSASQMSVVGDVIAKTAAVSMTSVEKMSESFRVASAVAQQFGVTLQDSALNLAFLSQIGITGTAAGTAMTNFYQYMIAGSGPAVKALKAVGLQMIDLTTGNAKSYMAMLAELDGVLSKRTYSEQQHLMSMMTTNRGLKSVAAGLVAYRTEVKQLDPVQAKLISQLEASGKAADKEAASVMTATLTMTHALKLKKQLEDAPGFTAIAAAGKSLTPENQMKGLKASLENDLVKAFEKVSDVLYVVGSRLRAVLNSDEFRTAIAGMVRMVAGFVEGLVNLIAWTAKNSDALRSMATAVAVGVSALVAGTAAFYAYGAAVIVIKGAIALFTGGLGAARLALLAMNATLLTTPAGWIALGVAAVAAGVAYVAFGKDAKDGLDQAQTAEKELAEANSLRNKDFISSLQASLQGYKDRAQAAKELRTVEEVQAERALNELNARADQETALTVLRLQGEKAVMIAQAANFQLSKEEIAQRTAGIDSQIRMTFAASDRFKTNAAALVAEVKAAAAAAAKLDPKVRPKGPLGGDPDDDGKGKGKVKNQYESLLAAMQAVADATNIELGNAKQVSEADKFRIDNLKKINLALKEKALTPKEGQALKAFEKEVEAQIELNIQLKAQQKLYEENVAERTKYTATNVEGLAKLEEEIEKQELHNASLGLGKEAVAALEAANVELQATKLESLAIDELVQHQDTRNYETTMARASAMRKLAAAKREGGAKEEAADSLKKAAEESKKFTDKIEDSLTDAIMRGFDKGKGFAENFRDTIVNMFKTMVLRPMVSAVVGPVAGGLTSMFGGPASAGQGGAGGASGLSTVQTLKGVYDAMTTGFATVGASVSSGFTALATSSAGQALGMSANVGGGVGVAMMPGTASFGAAMGAFATAAAPILGGIAIGSLIAGDKVVLGMDGTTTAAIGTAIGFAVGGPIGALIGGAVGGLANAMFGNGPTELRGQGTRGTFGSSGFSGENYANMHQSGGWFSSDNNWTETSSIDPKLQKQWTSAFTSVKMAVATTALSLGLSVAKINTYSKSIDLAAGATKETVEAVFTNMADEMATSVAPALNLLTREGETASAALQRMGSSLTLTNTWLKVLGLNLLQTSLIGGEIASQLADAFGGLEAMASASKTYSELFYSEAERAAASQDGMTKALSLVNLAMPQSKDAFRDLVSSLNLATDSGRKAYAVLLSIAPEFAATADTLARLNGDIIRAVVSDLRAAQKDLPKNSALSGDVSKGGLSDFNKYFSESLGLLNDAVWFDGSITALKELSSESTRMYQSALSLVQQIAQASKSASASFEASKRSIKLDVLDTEGKYAFFDSEIARYTDILKSLTDPSAIADYSARIENAITSGWGLLSEEQKMGTSDKFLTLLSNADDLTKGRFQAATDMTLSQAQFNNQVVANSISASITAALEKEAVAREARAAAQHIAALAAAEAMRVAAAAVAAAAARAEAAAEAQRAAAAAAAKAASEVVWYAPYESPGGTM